MARHRRPTEDSDDVTDIIAVEVPLDTPTSKPKPKPKAPPWEKAPTTKPKPAVKSSYAPMFKGFDRTSPLPKTPTLLAKPEPPPEPPAIIRRRISILILSSGLALISFGLMLWSFMSQPTCAQPPPLRPPITITVGPTPPTYIPHHY